VKANAAKIHKSRPQRRWINAISATMRLKVKAVLQNRFAEIRKVSRWLALEVKTAHV